MAQLLPRTRQIVKQFEILLQQPRRNDPSFECVYAFEVLPDEARFILEIFPEGKDSRSGTIMDVTNRRIKHKAPNCIIRYSSEQAFIDLCEKKIKPRQAYWSGDISFDGIDQRNMKFLMSLINERHRKETQGTDRPTLGQRFLSLFECTGCAGDDADFQPKANTKPSNVPAPKAKPKASNAPTPKPATRNKGPYDGVVEEEPERTEEVICQIQ